MNSPEVLLVDDDIELAQAISRVIAKRLAVVTSATNDPAEALDLVKSEGIRVAILDQRMPEITGVELMKQIREADGRTKVVLLSGLADNKEVISAYEGHVNRFIHKDDWRTNLVPAIEVLLAEYEEDLVKDYQAVAPRALQFTIRVGLPILGAKVSYRLVSIDEVDEDYVADTSWRSAGRIEAGVEEEITSEVEWKSVLETISRLQETVGAETTASAGKRMKLTGKLRAEITAMDEYKAIVETREKVTIRRKLMLQAEPSDPDQLHVRARDYEVAPVFMITRITLAGSCRTCQRTHVEKVTTFLPRKRIATRQIDYMSDNSGPRIIDTGIRDIADLS